MAGQSWKKVGQLPHIAIDPLDQLARRVGQVEAEILPHQMSRQVGAQGKGGMER